MTPDAIHETLRNFLSLAKGERVLPHFIGSLAACLFPNTSVLPFRNASVVGTPVFYVIREDSIDVFNREESPKADNVLGLAYGLLKQNRPEELRFCDFSIGLLSTLPEYRRQGHAKRALASTAVAFHEMIAAHDGLLGLKPHCFINTENLPSQRLVDPLGFKIVPDKTFHWLRHGGYPHGDRREET
ncbi:hypothetical protein Ae201684_010676 [Aphanomyces euteiches]|uniref:Uncharacterized protein n=1 Tax=Aphanomyces euteiches TaxID=100861 RepID=A0A6G0WWZ4_9STRA|nr:hypothetical protein Ae201684_010676 [Aphanomyces euteiches]